ncbi:MAG: hypothetical protein II875_09635 [Clostridia bacterium]|nr:hypothetical protein [Clostridia bacterium]
MGSTFNTDLSDVILLSGVNLKRNYADKPFPDRLDGDKLLELREGALARLNERFSGIRLEKAALQDASPQSLGALIENACFYDDGGEENEKALRVSLVSGTKLSISLNRGDHLNISAFIRDGDVQRALGIVQPVEKALMRQEEYAFSENWGYLTSSVKYTGNALTGAYLLSLTGLNRMNLLDDEKENLKKHHLELKRLIGTEEDDCELFCLHSTLQLGKSAQDVLSELMNCAQELAFRERDAREELIYDDTDDFADSVMRALGILMNARLMDFQEFLTLYSDVRAGLATGFVEGSIKDLDEIASEVSPEEIRRGYNDLSRRDEELLRADICRRRFSENMKTIRI